MYYLCRAYVCVTIIVANDNWKPLQVMQIKKKKSNLLILYIKHNQPLRFPNVYLKLFHVDLRFQIPDAMVKYGKTVFVIFYEILTQIGRYAFNSFGTCLVLFTLDDISWPL